MTAILTALNNLAENMDRKLDTAVILIDQSAVYDTIDHVILIIKKTGITKIQSENYQLHEKLPQKQKTTSMY